jgi:hypothetical protein
MKIYDKAKEILRLAWKDDDLMGQDTLFKLQDDLAILVLSLARANGRDGELSSEFPWIFKKKGA